MELTQEKLDEIKALVGRATPGRWLVFSREAAEYISVVNPETVKAMIGEIESLRSQLAHALPLDLLEAIGAHAKARGENGRSKEPESELSRFLRERIKQAGEEMFRRDNAKIAKLEKERNDWKARAGDRSVKNGNLAENLQGCQAYARKLDREANWLAERLYEVCCNSGGCRPPVCPDPACCVDYAQRDVASWREAARRAVEAE